MSDTLSTTDAIDTRADLGTDDAAKWAFWMGEDRIAGKEEDRWQKRGQKIVKRYRDERGAADRSSGHKFNVLWSNVQTLIPTLYARTPKPDVVSGSDRPLFQFSVDWGASLITSAANITFQVLLLGDPDLGTFHVPPHGSPMRYPGRGTGVKLAIQMTVSPRFVHLAKE